jgi:hypothetical protein
MSFDTFQVLFTGIEHNDVHRVVSMLESYEVDFHRVPWNERLVATTREREFDLIIAGFPPQGMEIEGYVLALRRHGSASCHAGLVLLADPQRTVLASRLLGRGVNRVVSRAENDDYLRESLLSLLGIARRVPMRAPVEISAKTEDQPKTAYCHTENLSASGMLLSCSNPSEIGATLDFVLSIPGERLPIRGRARVARHTDPRRERVIGVGASFLSFAGTDRTRLRNALWRQVH